MQLSKTFTVVSDHEDQRVVEPGRVQFADHAAQYRVRKMQSAGKPRAVAAGLNRWEAVRHVIRMMCRVEIDHREKRPASVFRPREGSGCNLAVVDPPAVEGMFVLICLRRPLRDQLFIERQQIVETIHVFAVEEGSRKKSCAISAVLEFAGQREAEITVSQFFVHAAPGNDLAAGHYGKMRPHGAGKRSIDTCEKHAVTT